MNSPLKVGDFIKARCFWNHRWVAGRVVTFDDMVVTVDGGEGSEYQRTCIRDGAKVVRVACSRQIGVVYEDVENEPNPLTESPQDDECVEP